tara:strand:+ start:115 stop:348 length:234 start_codon:yes stop_codon:yes gene_type:complete
MEFKRIKEEIERLNVYKSSDLISHNGIELLAELEQALQLLQTDVSGCKVFRNCKECNKKINCDKDFCEKKCETLYYR